MPVEATRLAIDRNTGAGRIRFEARAGDAVDGDAVAHELPVRKYRVIETAANYGSTMGEPVTESLLFPPGIHTDAGEIGVDLSASIIGNLDGAFRYIRGFDYPGWEQRLSRGVMASHYVMLRAWLDDDLDWPQSTELPTRLLADAASYQAPNGGMAYFIAADAYVSPYLSAYTALAFNWLRGAGYRIPGPVETRLHDYLENLLRRNTVPSFYTRGMTASVRAVALAALAPHGRDLPRRSVAVSRARRLHEPVRQGALSARRAERRRRRRHCPGGGRDHHAQLGAQRRTAVLQRNAR